MQTRNPEPEGQDITVLRRGPRSQQPSARRRLVAAETAAGVGGETG